MYFYWLEMKTISQITPPNIYYKTTKKEASEEASPINYWVIDVFSIAAIRSSTTSVDRLCFFA